jgi:hypothetical protein
MAAMSMAAAAVMTAAAPLPVATTGGAAAEAAGTRVGVVAPHHEERATYMKKVWGGGVNILVCGHGLGAGCVSAYPSHSPLHFLCSWYGPCIILRSP